MSLETIYYISSIIGTIAIVLSIVILVRDLRQNTKTLKSTMAREAGNGIQSWYLTIGNSPESSKIWINGMANPDSLSQEQLLQFFFLCQSVFWAFQTNYYLSKEGALDSQIESSITHIVLNVIEQPGFLLFWEQRQDLFFPEFREYIEDIFTQKPTKASVVYKAVQPD